MKDFRVGVDIGGTFTDVVFLGNEGTVLALKLASTPDDYSLAVLDGIRQGIGHLEIEPGSITELGHGFTIATNAILEEKGARAALITTEGFRDVLEFRRNRVPRLYDLAYVKPPALVKRHLRFEVAERLDFRGVVLRPLDMESVERTVDRVIAAQVDSVVICLLHSYANPAHEQLVAAALRRRAPNLTLTLSSELLPIIKEYERTSTAVINGYVRPVVERYLGRLTQGLHALGVDVPLGVMQSNGGLATAQVASERPAFCIESGPAAGVMGAYHLARKLEIANVLTLDMGGTTAKASIIENGEVLRSKEYEVGAGLNVGHRLLRGAGHVLSVPAIDVAEVGAGGGSTASVDGSGSLRVGPQSAGAVPGPACYSRGGDHAAVTDANVLLGYLNPRHLLGGEFPLDQEKARAAIARDVAGPLGVTEIEAAHGVHLLANSNMSRALKAVSSERGRDPRRFTLIAFGGSGPAHAAGLAEMLGIRSIVVPPYPGVFSAFGLLFTDIEHHLTRTYFKSVADIDLAAFRGVIEGLRGEARQVLRSERFADERQEIRTSIDLKYEGQGSELTVRLPAGEITAQTLQGLAEAFDAEHEKTFGHRTDAPHQIVNIRVVARGLSEEARIPERLQMADVSRGRGERKRSAYFGARHGWVETPVVGRAELGTIGLDGPLLIEEYDSTTVVPPGWHAATDQRMNILLSRVAVTERVMRSSIDPVTREIVKNALMSIADTMALTVVRTARSAVVKDGMDFSTALFTADGQQVAQGLTLPAHLGSMAPALEGVMKAFGDDVQPEDIFAINDPYEGGSHLPDIFLFKPVFTDARLVAWTCAIGHQTDIGGRVAGGVACDNTEIFQEGLILPPLKLYDQGVLNRAVWRILEKNVRVPHKVIGDVRALLSAVRLGERDLLALLAEYGRETLIEYMKDILDTTERLTRAEIAKLPQGEWEFTDYVDNDGIDLRPIAIRAHVRIAGDRVYIDFSGTSPQAKGSINPNFNYTKSQAYAVMKCLIDPEIQSNSGFFRAFQITAPEGCFVNPQHPAPVAARGLAGFRVCNAIFGAMAKALPGRIPAAWGGGEVGLSFAGYDAHRKAWIHLDLINDGPRGGGPDVDGADGLSAPIHNMANMPIETVEAEQPLLIERYALVPDTGGPGKYRGGLAIIRDFRILADDTTFQLRSDRTDFVPWGIEGGKAGTPTLNHLNPDRENRQLPGKTLMKVKKGDLYRLVQASGGGYGDPLERELAAILEDVRQEKLTPAHARQEYGAVVESATLTLDLAASKALRAEIRATRQVSVPPRT